MFVQKYLAARREGSSPVKLVSLALAASPGASLRKYKRFFPFFFFFSCVLPEKEIIAVETGDKCLGVTKAMQEIKVMRKM